MPIVEPEVLLDGEHGIDRTLEVAEQIWAETFKYMADNKVMFEGILLKPSMVSIADSLMCSCLAVFRRLVNLSG